MMDDMPVLNDDWHKKEEFEHYIYKSINDFRNNM
jgi:hypothetical protein